MGSKKTKTSQVTTNHSVTTPTLPDWLSNGTQSLNQAIQKIGAADPYSFVAPVSALEQKAAAGAGQLGDLHGVSDALGASSDWLGKVLAGQTPSVTSASLLDNLSAYYSPFRDQVTDAAMADFDADAGRTRAAQDLSIAGQGAFGGSGAALAKSQTEGELARARNTRLSQLLSDMFTTSASLSGQDADRRQQASAANARLALDDTQFKTQSVLQNSQMQVQAALDRAASDRADVTSQAAVGGQLRAADDLIRKAPITTLGSEIDMFSGLPTALFRGEVTDSNGTNNGTEKTSGATIGELASLVSSLSGFKLPSLSPAKN